MSTPINNLHKDHQGLMDSLRRQNEKEVENTELTHKNLINEKVKQHEKNLDYEISKNESNVNIEAEKTEKALEKLRQNLKLTQDFTDKELTKIKKDSTKEKVKTLERLSEDKQRFYLEHDNALVEMNDKFNLEQSDQNRRHDLVKKEQKYLHEREQINLSRDNTKKINDLNSDFRKTFKKNDETFNQVITKQKDDLKKQRHQLNQSHHHQLNKQQSEFSHSIDLNKDRHNLMTKDLNQDFEKRYSKNVSKNEAEFLRANDQKEREINKLKIAVQDQALKIENKKDDPFFHFTKLSPKVTDLGDKVKITVEVPEYAKNELLMTLNHKTAILTINRRFSDESKDEFNNQSKINRIESYVSKVDTGSILDPKKIESSFENGVMSYIVKKA